MAELNITNAAAAANILAAVEARALVQNMWHGRAGDGREIACLLGAINPRVGRPADCNGKLMPMWLAELTPTLFDGIPAEQIYPIAQRYGELVAKWNLLSPEQWDRVLTRVLVRCINDAVAAARPVNQSKDYWVAVEAVCEQCKAAVQSGDSAAAARSAASAAESVAWSAASAAASAAWNAAWSAAASAAWNAAWSAAASAAYLSIFTFVLDQIETEVI